MPYFFVRSFRDTPTEGIKTFAGTVGQQRINMEYVRNYAVPLPPIPEQQRIVDRVEKLFAMLDEARDKAQAVVDGYELRRAAILYRAFSGELTANQRNKRNVDFSTWEKTTLSNVVLGFRYGTSEKSSYDFSGMPVLRIPNIGENTIDFSDIKYLRTSDMESNSQIHEGDILIIRSNGSRDLVGKSALVPKLEREYAYASFLIRIIPNQRINSDFLVLFLNSASARIQMFQKAKSTSGIHNINSKELGAVEIDLPELWEQKKIVEFVSAFMEREQQAKTSAEKVLTTIDMMKKKILGFAFRGLLGTNDPAEPCAEIGGNIGCP